MAILVADPYVEDRLLAERRVSGADRYDEVWEGVYMMVPMPNDEHQEIVSHFVYVFEEVLGLPGLGKIRPGVNLSDRGEDWNQDYRVPDVAVFLGDGPAENCGTHWRGGADFLVEIISPHDRTREKIPFYSQLGVRELLLVDRDPWSLELYRHQQGQLEKVAQSTLDADDVLSSTIVPLTFQILPGDPRPQIQVEHSESGRRWPV